ncbi:lysophospholipid acyltransferase family protein [Amaricoccus tamworthensis]|uniref:lysophospholipid acyltransferase family protein n=1 Tax=Amaricoccus tamworthensis TaxID=57002 RepID=UPI003C7AD0D2
MSISWNDAEPPALPPMTATEKMRAVLRGGLALFWTLSLLILFFLARAVDVCIAWITKTSHISSRVVQLWAAGALPLMGLKYRQHGTPLAGGGAFLANHSSWIDIVVLQCAAAPFLVSKSEVRSWPGIGLIGRAIGTMFIERNPARIRQQQAELEQRLRNGDRMALFPEGTSTDGLRVLRFKSSLFSVFFSAGMPEHVLAQPVCIRYRTLNTSLPEEFYGWWGDMDFGSHLAQVLGRSGGGTVDVTFLEPMDVASFATRKDMAREATSRVMSAFEARSA